MGLSKDERQDQMTFQADHIFRLACEIKEAISNDKQAYYNKRPIIALCDEACTIWHALFRSRSNGAYWILGGSVGADIKCNEHDPLSLSIRHFLDSHKPKDETDNMLQKYDNDHYHEQQLTHECLTENASPVFGKILKLYSGVEALMYALRRYDDEFRRSYAELDALLSSIYGQCYRIFRSSDIVVQCYLIADISKMLLSNETFDSLCKKMNLQHDMRYLDHRDINDLVDLHQKLHESLVINKKGGSCPPLYTCVKVFLKLANRRFHYDHQFNQLKTELQKSKEFVDWCTVESLFKDCQKAHSTHETNDQEAYRSNDNLDHMQAIHGWDYHLKPKQETKLASGSTSSNPRKIIKKESAETKNHAKRAHR